MGHRVLSQASCAEAHTLTERANPAFISAAIKKINFILSLEAEGTKLSIAKIIVLSKNLVNFIIQRIL